MSSKREIVHYISDTEPSGVQVGDEWYNTRLSRLYKRTLVSGRVGWLDITQTTPTSTSTGITTGKAIAMSIVFGG